MIKHLEANPLAVFNMRRMDFCPPHFEVMSFNLIADEKNILDWIYENTEGRFYFGSAAGHHSVAFENHAELSYFSLMLSQFNALQSY